MAVCLALAVAFCPVIEQATTAAATENTPEAVPLGDVHPGGVVPASTLPDVPGPPPPPPPPPTATVPPSDSSAAETPPSDTPTPELAPPTVAVPPTTETEPVALTPAPTPTPTVLPDPLPPVIPSDPPAPLATDEPVEAPDDPIPLAAQLPSEFTLGAAIVSAERAAASTADRAVAAERASAARTARIVSALGDYDSALAEVTAATRAEADARADYDSALSQSASVHRLAGAAVSAATASQNSLAALVRAMTQGESSTGTFDALLDDDPGANLLYRLGAMDRFDSLTDNIQTVRKRVLADRQRADDLTEQDAQLTADLNPAAVTAAQTRLADAVVEADARRSILLSLGSELSMTAALFSGSDLTLSTLLSAADVGRLSAQGWTLPAVGRITSGYGPRPDRPIAGVGATHYGTDLGAACGASVYAATSGIVAAVGEVGSFGNWILIDHGESIATGYAHVATGSTRVAVGERVDAGQVIAAVGSTGASTGCHLHLEVRLEGIRVDAVPFLESRGIRFTEAILPQ